MRNGEKFTVCYYDSEIRPKLMDCDLGEGTYQVGGAYLLLYSGTTDFETYEFMFTFDPPLIISSFTLHYYCNRQAIFIITHDLRTSQSSQQSIRCGTGHQMNSFTGSTPSQNVTVNFAIPSGFREGGGIFLSEVQFFSGADSVLADPCTVRSCCANEAVCHVSSTVPNGYECECLDGFSGVNCQFRNCTSLRCQNGGTCTDVLGDYNCACQPGYTGKRCEVMLTTRASCGGEVCPQKTATQTGHSTFVFTPTPTPKCDSVSSSDWIPWTLTGVFAVLFLSTSTTTIVLAVLVWRRRKEPPKIQLELETNPSYSCPNEVHIYDNADKM